MNMALIALLLLLFPQPAVRFAWLSDTHVGSETGADDLRAAVADINGMPDVQFVIVSGDVTESGSDAQLAAAKQILDSLKPPYHAIPGNHDTKWSESGCTTFPRLWGAERFVLVAGGIRFIGFHEGPRMRMADGYFGPEDLRWLDSTLTAMPDPRQPVMAVTHYPLDSGIANWYEAVERLKRRNTQMVFVGHGHRNRIDDYEGLPGLMGRSALRGAGTAGGFTLVTITGDSIFAAEHRDGAAADSLWYRGARRGAPYEAGGAAMDRPDYGVNNRYPGIRELWRWATGWTVASGASAAEGRVVTGDGSGRITALDARTGGRLWSFATGGPVYGTPAIARGRVVAGSADGAVYCLNLGDGSLLWRTRTGGPVLGCPLVHDDTIFVGGSDRRLRALRLGSGAVLWTSDSLGGFVETTPLLVQGRVVFGAWDDSLHALDARTGRTDWSWAGGHPGMLYSPAACRPVASHGRVFIVAPDRQMSAIDAASGRTIWRSGRFQVRESIGASRDGARIYIRAMRDTIAAIDPAADTCRALWVSDAGFGYDINPASLVEEDSTVYYGTKNGLVLALDAHSGAVRWKRRVGPALINTVLPLGNRRLVLTDFDGIVHCLKIP